LKRSDYVANGGICQDATVSEVFVNPARFGGAFS